MNNAGTLSTPRIRLPGLFWLTLAAITFAGIAVCLSIWIPHLQRDRAIAEIKRQGGIVTTQPDPAAHWTSWLTGDGEMIVGVDLSSVE
ncbi:MAG: hypothetical protein IID45_10705, partial [Planctomycetes bacterium]|nr:hypothetical protein [Planctomycetota bacterium]